MSTARFALRALLVALAALLVVAGSLLGWRVLGPDAPCDTAECRARDLFDSRRPRFG